MTRYIRVDYFVRTEVNLDELKTAIGEFVAGIRRHHPEHRYISTPSRSFSVYPHWRGSGGGAPGSPEAVVLSALHGLFAGTVLRRTRGDPVGSRGFDGCSAGGAVR